MVRCEDEKKKIPNSMVAALVRNAERDIVHGLIALTFLVARRGLLLWSRILP